MTSGPEILVNGILVIIYTGINEDNQQVQCQARPAGVADPTLT